jgi:short subunit dehydrogenase-like uncharacterized protein
MAAPNQTGPIAVYGATGYTGKLVAKELAPREADFGVVSEVEPLPDPVPAAR